MSPDAVPSPRRRLPADIVVEPWTAPGGWTLRGFRLEPEGAAKGRILFLGGRGDFFEKYVEAFAHWRSAGWRVAGFDWRGQGGSGRFSGSDFCHIEDFGTFVGDLAAYCAAWGAEGEGEGPRVVVGHSMGGHVLLRAAVEGLVAVDGMVLLAPMLGIRAGLLRGRTLRTLAALGRTPGLRRRAIWSGPRSPVPGRITSCPDRQADKLWWKAARPDLARGGPTWGWLAAATASIALLERELRAGAPEIPGLLLAAANDPVVDPAAIARAARILPGFEYHSIARAGHELLRESDGPRGVAMAHIDRFLDRLAVRA